jgi:hypothetical protein
LRTSTVAVLADGRDDLPSRVQAVTASVLVRDLLVGPVRPAAVVATGPRATYLDVGGRLLAVVAADGVRLPCAAMLGPGGRPPTGPDLAVGDGGVYRAGRRVAAVGSWFDPRVRVGQVDYGAVGWLAAALCGRRRDDALLPGAAIDRLAFAWGGDGLDAAVAGLVGRGSGLTPAGDDLLAGALAALRALAPGSAEATRLAAAVRRWAPGRTTRLSVALLEAADQGAVIPEAAAVLRALVPPAPVDRLGEALDRLVGVGHTSGWHLAAGLVVGACRGGVVP